MAYDEALAARIRRALSAQPKVVEKRAFGGITFMVAGNMCCGVNKDDLVLRLDGKTAAKDLGSPHVRPWDFMKRPMKGMFAVGPQGCATQDAVEHWVQIALKHALTLPEK
jgi:TfoX/Sxy family transcriptional regulator of competence genes